MQALGHTQVQHLSGNYIAFKSDAVSFGSAFLELVQRSAQTAASSQCGTLLRLYWNYRGSFSGICICTAGTKLVEYTDKTAAEVDEMIKLRAEKNKALNRGAAVPPLQ